MILTEEGFPLGNGQTFGSLSQIAEDDNRNKGGTGHLSSLGLIWESTFRPKTAVDEVFKKRGRPTDGLPRSATSAGDAPC